MSEVSFVAGEADAGLQKRLDEEISAVNAAATGHHDGRLPSIAVRGDSGDLRAGLYGWTWGGCGYIDCSGCATTSAVAAWEQSSSPQPKLRSGAAAATG